MSKQLQNFTETISKTFANERPLKTPLTWEEAFSMLTQELETMTKSKKVVVFLDELPWFVTRRSGLIQALDYYWNAR